MARSWLARSPADPAVPEDARGQDLPVVARLVVEIRSDGSRTVARGALEDLDGQRVAVEAHGTTPWSLAKQLAVALWRIPRVLPGRDRDR